MTWMHRLRMRTMAYVLGLLLAGFTVAAAFTLPLLPVLGVAVAAAAVVVNQAAFRLVQPTCYGCGKNISGIRGGAYGVQCPDCGSLTQVLPRAGRLAVLTPPAGSDAGPLGVGSSQVPDATGAPRVTLGNHPDGPGAHDAGLDSVSSRGNA